MTAWDPVRTAQFFDEYGEREWTRFEDGRTPAPSVATHIRMLERYVGSGDRVLDAGCGPGRFTVELERLGALVTALDISPRQIELLRQRIPEINAYVGDIVDLSLFADGSFDATVCFGGPLSYLVDRAPDALAELARVTRPGGHVLVSVMSLGGTVVHYASVLADLARRDGTQRQLDIARSQLLPEAKDYGHLAMRLYRWRDLEQLLERHGEVVDGAAAGVLPHVQADEPEIKELLADLDAELADDPALRGVGEHIIGVVRTA
jgi:SAM-dependent methyltransferase